MNQSNSDSTEQKRAWEAALESLHDEIKADTRPEELQLLRKLIRRNIPFSLRRYLAAYLLRERSEASGTGGAVRSSSPEKKPASARRPRKAESGQSGRAEATTEGTTLFIGIGKKRRIFPKDLSRLLQETGGLAHDDIRGIKILENYSFVTVAPASAGEVIERLNGSEFRGRPLTCDYARSRNL